MSAILLDLLVSVNGQSPAEDGFRLVWSDEFNVDGPADPKKWSYERGFVRNKEAQWYREANAVCRDGFLVIEGRRETVPNPGFVPGSKDWRKARKQARYTSSSLTTKGRQTWTYGRFEMRARIDARPGLWPAFWTVGDEGKWPQKGEVDIMEYYRGDLLANVIWGKKGDYRPIHDTERLPLAKLGGPGWKGEFHVWRMDWDKGFIRLYVDGRLLNETKLSKVRACEDGSLPHPFRHPHYLILNLAIGGTAGGDASKTAFPARYEVDWVRVYQRKD